MNYVFSLGCKKDKGREKAHQGPLTGPREKTFLVPGRTDPIPQRHPGNDFSSDRDAKEHRNALRNNHGRDIHITISTLPHHDDEK
jgi:hypothetical protein